MRCVLLLCLACACSDTDPVPLPGDPGDPGALSKLSLRGGCADVTFEADRPDEEAGFQSIFLHVGVPGLLSRANQERREQKVTFDLPDPDITVELVTGEELGGPCLDYAGKHEVHAVYRPTAGRATILVIPDLDPDPAADMLGRGWLWLDDLVLETDSDAIEVDGFVIENAVVGTTLG